MPDTVVDVYHRSPNQAVASIHIPAGTAKQLVIRLRHPDGSVISAFTPDHVVDLPPRTGIPEVTEGGVAVRLGWTVEPLGIKILIDGSVHQERPEFVVFHALPEHTRHVGMHYAQIGRFVGQHLIDTWPVFLVCEPSVFGETAPQHGPLTTAEVRMALLDFVSDNPNLPQLLDDVEFTDAEISHAIKRCVDLWNETPPHVSYHTVETFPYRHWWTVGATALCLRAAAARYRRHALAYAAGGVSINDTAKATEYEQISMARMKEFTDWMMAEKVAINRGYCWGVGI